MEDKITKQYLLFHMPFTIKLGLSPHEEVESIPFLLNLDWLSDLFSPVKYDRIDNMWLHLRGFVGFIFVCS